MSPRYHASCIAASSVGPFPRNGALRCLAVLALFLVSGAAFGQANLLTNPGFEQGNPAMGWWGIPAWTNAGDQWGGQALTNGGPYAGTNLMRMNSFNTSSHILNQEIAITAGRIYEADGWMKTGAGADQFTPTNGYCTILTRFFDNTGSKIGDNCDSVRFGAGGSATWAQYSTGPMVAPGGSVTAMVSCFYFAGGDATATGYVYYDSMRFYTSQATRAGALLNPGFEVNPVVSTFTNIPYWQGFGNAGAVVTNYAKNGRRSLQIWFTENLQGQSWNATVGTKYACSGYIYNPASQKFASTTNSHGVILLQFLDVTGTNVLTSYESAYFTPASPSNQWLYYEASGFAPVGTVSGRTMCAILGATNGYSGSLYFDDMSQRVVQVSDTVSGLLHNVGFDDGPAGNAYNLDATTNLPYWKWLGGTNGGFVTTSYARDGSQSLAITFPGNLAGQTAVAKTGCVYVLEGYMSSPVGQKLSNSAYGVLLLEFYKGSYKNGTSAVSVVESAHFTSSATEGTWYKFAVTNRAPWSGAVTCRVLCAVMGSTQNYGGAVHFDSLSLWETTNPVSDTQSGTIWNPGFEYTADGTVLEQVDKWTALGNAGLVGAGYPRTANRGLRLYGPETLLAQPWAASPGTRYSNSCWAATPSTDRLQGVTNLHGVLLLQYLDNTTNILATYESPWFGTNIAPNTWTHLTVQGLAPAGTVTGRTVLALLGTNTGFAGSLWFDDVQQGLGSSVGTTSGVIYNPGFEDGMTGNANYLSNDLPHWVWAGGTNAGFIVNSMSYSGAQSLAIVYPNNLLYQNFAAKTGMSYVAEGWMRTPTSDRMTSTTAYATFLLEFFTPAGGSTSVSVVTTAKLTNGTPADTWIKFCVTNHAPWGGTWVTGRISCALLDASTNSPYGGTVYFDNVSVWETNIPFANSLTGALWNAGFEYTAKGTKLPYVDNWAPLGLAGSVEDFYRRSGANALQLYAPETLSAQYWGATQGTRYACSAYAYTPTGVDRLKGATNLHAVVLLQYMDNTGTNVLVTYESEWFTTNKAAGVWTNLSVSGIAPAGTVSGRTVLALLGTNAGFGGTVWFDDAYQWIMSSTGTMSGKLRNPGFEDGPPGNAYNLSLGGDLPYWTWYGGTNAGFIATTYKYEGAQALSIVYPGNLCGQRFNAITGNSYIVEGWMYTPTSAVEKLAGTAYGVLYLEFYNGNYQNGTSAVSVVESAHFTVTNTAGTWQKFSVTNRAPWLGPITGRVLCAVMGSTQAYGGAVYFDGLTVMETNFPTANSQSGALWNPGFEYTSEGTILEQIDNWTALGNAGQVAAAYPRSGGRALKLYASETLLAQRWTATPGYRYSSSAYAYTPSADRLQGATNLHAVVLLQYLDNTTNILATYESAWFRTNNPAAAWTQLTVSGVAPVGTVTGRTVLGLLGTNLGFAGSVWFDDASQALVSTGTTQYGQIYNGGFDDGIVGDAYFLGANLPNWTWLGGSNAGFVVNDVSLSNGQSLAIVYPNNLAAQNFPATTGLTYVVEGYMYTPSGANRMTGSTAYAQILLEFFTPAGTMATSVSVVGTAKLTNGSPADVWTKVMVTNRAPNTGAWVTGRVSCAYLDLLGGTVGGSVYFDCVRVSVTTVAVANTTNGTIWNPGFEFSPAGTKLPFLDNWTGLGHDGGVDDVYKRSGNQSLKLYFTEHLAVQSWSCTSGARYSTTAWGYTPTETESTNWLINGALNLVGFSEAPTGWTGFDTGNHEADYWHYLSGTNAWMFYWGGGIYQDITAGFVPGDRFKFGGYLYTAAGSMTNGDKYGVIELEFYNSTNGLISTARAYPTISSNTTKDVWAYSAGQANVPFGTVTMRILVRCNVPTSGSGAFTAEDIFLKRATPPAVERFASATNTHGVVLLQYLNNTGGVVATYESPWFTTATAPGTWTSMTAVGLAPGGAVSGRTAVAILGSDTGYAGAIWFDDVSQSLVSTGVTQYGLIYNGGFDDGLVGDAYFLSNDLPRWAWLGGSNAGFVVNDVSLSNGQSLAIVYPNNLAAQTFAATTGLVYTVEGYMYTPNGANRMTGSTAYAQILLEFFTPAGGMTSSVSVVGTPKLTNGSPAGVWTKVMVTNRAPWVGSWVTGRVSCAYLDILGGTVGGSVYFDCVRVSVTTVATANTTNGAIWNPGFEYTANGTKLAYLKDNWQGLGLAGNVDDTYKHGSNQSLKIYAPETLAVQSWNATPGWRYSTTAWGYTPTETESTNWLINGALNLVGLAQAPTGWTSFDDGSHEADYWHYLSGTNAWMFYWGGGIYQDLTAGFVPGDRFKFGGYLHIATGDTLTGDKQGLIQLEFYNATNGLILQSTAYPIAMSNSTLNQWIYSFGQANVPFGTTRIRMVARCNATSGTGAFTAEDLFLKRVTPAAAERFASPTNTHGVVLLQYFNTTGGVLATYESPWFTTATAPGTWTSMTAVGVAPAGTVSGRTAVAILGSSTGYSGAIWFDDVSQSLVSTGGTVSGLLHNPGFDDGVAGNAYYLSNDLPYWAWIGGSNAGYVTPSYKYDGEQSLSITFPDNLAVQRFNATTGRTYIVEGYMYTPTSARLTGQAYGVILLEFYNGAYNKGTSVVSVVESGHFTASSPADTWVKFTVTNRAPWSGSITGRVICAMFGSTQGFGGSVHFDGLTLSETTNPISDTQSGALWNPGFEYTANGTVLPQLDKWVGLGLAGNVDATYVRSGSRALKIYAPETLAAQTWVASQGWKYASSAYVYTPSDVGPDLLLNSELTGSGDSPTSWSAFDAGSHDANTGTYRSSPNSWMFWWSGGLYQDVSSGFSVGDNLQFGGYFYTDAGSMTNGDKYGVVQVEFYNSTNGLISSANSSPTVSSNSVKGTWFLSQGNATVPSGAAKARVIVRCNVPTLGEGAFSADDLFLKRVSLTTNRLNGVTNLHAVVLQQFFNAAGGLLQTYESAWFTTNTPAGAWTQLTAVGVAPVGSVTGRTLVALLGTNTGFNGFVVFDDASQWVVSTTGSMSGLLHNPGFDDGAPGNAYDLWRTNGLPYWRWAGGTNAGFIARDWYKDNEQALVITYPQNGAGQTFACQSGHTYLAEGYLLTPSTAKFNTDGSSWGWLEMTFYVGGDTNPATEFTRTSVKFTKNHSANTWHYFAVTGTAPSVAIVSGKLSCVMWSDNPGGDLDLAGVIYFDQLSVVDMQGGSQTSSWSQWQMDNFGSTNAPNTGYTEDYDSDGYNNYSEFISGSQPTNKNSVWEADAVRQSVGQYVITWPSKAGRWYTLRRATNIVNTVTYTVVSSNIAATVPLNTYTDAPPSTVATYYYRVSATTNTP